MSFAEGTTVPVEKSRSEIEKLVAKAGATAFSSAWEPGRAIVVFRLRERFVRFSLVIPDENDKRFRSQRSGHNTAAHVRQRHEQELRRIWRCLLLVIKAKLEAVTSGIVSFEQEFLSYVLLPDGSTVAERVTPMIAEAYDTGAMPRAMLALGPGGGQDVRG